MTRRDAALGPEPDAPIRVLRFVRHSTALYPAAVTETREHDRDQALRRELERLVAERLDADTAVAISVVAGRVLLSGSVSCPLASLLAEDLVFALPEVRECRNELVVRPRATRPA